MEEILILATSLAFVVTGVVEVVKRATGIEGRFLPLLALVVGGAVGAGAYFIDAEIGMRIWAGGIAGLTAVGVFEGFKGITKGDDY